MKTKFVEYYKGMLDSVKKLSTCYKRKVAAIVTTNDGRVLSMGYNGTPPGYFQCDELALVIDKLFSYTKDPVHTLVNNADEFIHTTLDNFVIKYDINTIYKILSRLLSEIKKRDVKKLLNMEIPDLIRELNFVHYKFEVHAEQNAISLCARRGISLENTSIFITMLPCIDCAKLIISSGIKTVYYVDEYIDKNYNESSKDFLEENGVAVIRI